MEHIVFDINYDFQNLIISIPSNLFQQSEPFTDKNVFGDEFLAQPLNQLSINDSGGLKSQHTMGKGTQAVWYNKNVQIKFRHTSKEAMHEWVELIKFYLNGKTDFIINGHYYMSCFQEGDILDEPGRDHNKCHISYLNFIVQVNPNYS